MPVEMPGHPSPAPGWHKERRVQPSAGAAPLLGYSWWHIPSRVTLPGVGPARAGPRWPCRSSGRGSDHKQRPPRPATRAEPRQQRCLAAPSSAARWGRSPESHGSALGTHSPWLSPARVVLPRPGESARPVGMGMNRRHSVAAGPGQPERPPPCSCSVPGNFLQGFRETSRGADVPSS